MKRCLSEPIYIKHQCEIYNMLKVCKLNLLSCYFIFVNKCDMVLVIRHKTTSIVGLRWVKHTELPYTCMICNGALKVSFPHLSVHTY